MNSMMDELVLIGDLITNFFIVIIKEAHFDSSLIE